MKKQVLLALALLLAALLLVGCGKQPAPAEVTKSPTQGPAMSQPTDVPLPEYDTSLPDDYDPASEEDPEARVGGGDHDPLHYAGATPVLLNPVDMPTPTPRQPLTFSYVPYVANALGLTFEAVAGYEVDESQADSFILTEPPEMMKDEVPVQITLSLTPVGANYKLGQLKSDLRTRLKDLGAVNYNKWSVSGLSARTLLGKDGYYGNFRGVRYDGAIVRGRIHMSLLDGKVLMLQLIDPADYNSDYMNVFSHIRKTLKAN